MLKVLLVFACSLTLLIALNWIDTRGKNRITEHFRMNRKKNKNRNNKRTNAGTSRDSDDTKTPPPPVEDVEQYNSQGFGVNKYTDLDLEWLRKKVDIHDDEKDLVAPDPIYYEGSLPHSDSDSVGDSRPEFRNDSHVKHPIKIMSKNVSIHDNTEFDANVVVTRNSTNTDFKRGITSFDDVYVDGNIKMNDIELSGEKLNKLIENMDEVNKLFTKYYLVDRHSQNVRKILPLQNILDEKVNCDTSSPEEKPDCERKKELVKEIIEIVRDGKNADSENGLCKKLNCPKIVQENPENHHCRAIFVNDKNDPLSTIDLRADEYTDGIYYEGAALADKNQNIHYDHLKYTNTDTIPDYNENDNLNTVILYKSNEDTQCELTLFREPENLDAYVANPDKPDLKYPCKVIDDKVAGLMKVYTPDMFKKEGAINVVSNGLCVDKVKYVDAMYLRVKK